MESQDLYNIFMEVQDDKKASRGFTLKQRILLTKLLMVAHIVLFISIAILNVILREVIQFQENVIEFMNNMKEIINLFGELM